MTDREKIIEILKQTSDIWKEEERHGYIVSVDLEKIADELIEAGFGDVKEVKMVANRYEMLYNMQARDMVLTKRKACDSEHRAEVAERALLSMTKKYNKAERKIATTKDGWFSLGEAQIALLVDDAIKQAEKELAEGNGNERL